MKIYLTHNIGDDLEVRQLTFPTPILDLKTLLEDLLPDPLRSSATLFCEKSQPSALILKEKELGDQKILIKVIQLEEVLTEYYIIKLTLPKNKVTKITERDHQILLKDSP